MRGGPARCLARTTNARALLGVDGHFVVLSGGGSWQTGLIRGAPVNDWRGGPMFQHEASDVGLAGKPHALLAPRVFQKTIEHANPASVAGDAVMQTHDHHPAALCAFFVELVELVFERLLVSGRVPRFEG